MILNHSVISSESFELNFQWLDDCRREEERIRQEEAERKREEERKAEEDRRIAAEREGIVNFSF